MQKTQITHPCSRKVELQSRLQEQVSLARDFDLNNKYKAQMAHPVDQVSFFDSRREKEVTRSKGVTRYSMIPGDEERNPRGGWGGRR